MGARNKVKKKVIIFIIEGKADKKALERIFKRIYSKKDIVFEFMSGDITSDTDILTSDLSKIIYKKAKYYMDQNKLKKKDLEQIVHLIDTDGAYIQDKYVEFGEQKEFFYSPTKITCKYPDNVKERNRIKKERIDYLLEMGNIHSFSYRVYFMSSNLDHALYGKQNLQDDLKEDYADDFYETFRDKEIKFIDFLEIDVKNGVPDEYSSSWRYIKEGLHSLERHTNLHIFFKENPCFGIIY